MLELYNYNVHRTVHTQIYSAPNNNELLIYKDLILFYVVNGNNE